MGLMLLRFLLQDSLLSNLIERKVIRNANLARMLLENFHNSNLAPTWPITQAHKRNFNIRKPNREHNLYRCKSLTDTSWVSLELVTGLSSFFWRVICFSTPFGTSFTICRSKLLASCFSSLLLNLYAISEFSSCIGTKKHDWNNKSIYVISGN